MALELNLYVDSSRQIELHQRVYRLLGWFQNVEQAFVRADFELLSRFLVDVRRPEHTVFVDPGRKGDGTRNARSGPPNGFDDLSC